MRSNNVYSALEEIYCGEWYIGKGGSSRVWEKDEYWDQMTRRNREE